MKYIYQSTRLQKLYTGGGNIAESFLPKIRTYWQIRQYWAGDIGRSIQ